VQAYDNNVGQYEFFLKITLRLSSMST